MTPEPLEVEVKLAVAFPRRLARLIRDPDPTAVAGFRPVGPPELVIVTDSYLDTDPVDGLLLRGAIRARLRSRGRRVTLTVKRPGQVRDGVTVRVELEAEATAATDPARWPASDARAAVIEAAGSSELHEIARIRQHRLTRLLQRGDTKVELSLDREDAMLDGRVLDRRYELEAELKSGDVDALAELGNALGRLAGVSQPLSSKLTFARDARRVRTGWVR